MIFTILLILYMVFGLVFYDLPYFQMVDEVFPFLLLAVSIVKGRNKCSRYLIVFAFILFFYLAYSFLIKSNVPKAIIFDAVCFSKPFLTLFSVLMLSPCVSKKECKIIRGIILAIIPVLIYAGINVHHTQETIAGQLLSGARFSFCCIYVGLTYYLFSNITFSYVTRVLGVGILRYKNIPIQQ